MDLNIPPVSKFQHHGPVPNGKGCAVIIVGVHDKQIRSRFIPPLKPGIDIHVPDLLVVLDEGSKKEGIRHRNIKAGTDQPESGVAPGLRQTQNIIGGAQRNTYIGLKAVADIITEY